MPQCSVIHMTLIEEEIECDTFFPAIDPQHWRLWSTSSPKRHKDLHYTFQCYVSNAGEASLQLPPALNTRHGEYQARSLKQNLKNDLTCSQTKELAHAD